MFRIKEVFNEAFGHRFFGFAMMALLPAFYIVIELWTVIGLKSFLWALGYVVFWLFIIRITLD